MANDQIGSTTLYVMVLNIVILGISYWEMNKDVDNGSKGSNFDLLAPFSSIYHSMENAIIGFWIAFVLAAIVVGVASILSEFNSKLLCRLVVRPMAFLFGAIILARAIVAMGIFD